MFPAIYETLISYVEFLKDDTITNESENAKKATEIKQLILKVPTPTSIDVNGMD